MSAQSVYDFAGGDAAFLALAAATHERCLRDPVLNHPFGRPGLRPDHVQRLASYWAEVFGGPARFSQSYGDQSGVLDLHARNGMQAGIGNRFTQCFVLAADDAGLPPDPRFRGVLRSYMEWAMSEVLAYQSTEATVAPGRPVPRWSWDGLVRGAE